MTEFFFFKYAVLIKKKNSDIHANYPHLLEYPNFNILIILIKVDIESGKCFYIHLHIIYKTQNPIVVIKRRKNRVGALTNF